MNEYKKNLEDHFNLVITKIANDLFNYKQHIEYLESILAIIEKEKQLFTHCYITMGNQQNKSALSEAEEDK